MPLRLLHLSDIHFGGYGPVWDEDDDQRDQLLEDAKRLVANGGPIDGILIGGDIAYSGQVHQYTRAQEWVAALVEVCRCRPEAVWVVPGNHDIDRGRLAQSAIHRDFRHAVRSCDLADLNAELRTRLANDPHCDVLVSTLEAYNEFALPWGCPVSAHQFHWTDKSLRLGDRPVVLWGMNSVLVSDDTDAAEDPDQGAEANLVLGTRQCQMPKKPTTVRIALVHHPPKWLKDWHQVKPYVDRAHVVLFGHEHRYAAQQESPQGTVYVHAGAVGPDQGPDWVPSYNLLTFDATGEELDLEVEPRRWNPNETCFVLHEDGRETFKVALDEETGTVSERSDVDLPLASEEGPANATPLSVAGSDGTASAASETPERRRELVFRYLSAAPTRRDEIARELGVFEESAVDLPEGEFYAGILRRIRDRELIDELAKELNE
jgi:3',5'-cyclic AMP phosphodiesterase CpdA